MKLIVFDIDGTLTQTNEVDSRCFEEALRVVGQGKAPMPLVRTQ